MKNKENIYNPAVPEMPAKNPANVLEWCHDWYDENDYGKSPGNDPKGPATGAYPIIRSGNYTNEPAIS